MNRLKNITNILIFLFTIICITTPAYAQLPEFFNFDENYYMVYGGPNVTATLIGDNEYSRGDTVTIHLNLMNKGVISGFKVGTDKKDLDDLEQKIQMTEMNYEAQRTTAIGIVAILNSESPYIKVRSGPQEAGSLPSGQQTDDPVQFNIQISKNAPAGIYPLDLQLYYGYQQDVQITGDDVTDLGITNMEVGLWYSMGQQNQTINIRVGNEAKFEVVNAIGTLHSNADGMLRVTYKNIGEMTAKDATVRISVNDPFSTTDDQAFLGTLEPGQTADALFKLKVDEMAVAKAYSINSEIKYEDEDGHSQISDTIKIRIETLPARSFSETLSDNKRIFMMIVIVAIAMGGFLIHKKQKQSKMDKE
ncbi:MAG: hypothetical protein WBL02_06220 [Methanomethylovorans sp.]|uniref:COG1361 S-layer family protein n=1 Tax=Methanomethylovorans sp. TaxID=2758717 RepID=UPI000B0E41A5|nr:hypothetical protein [Methanomethylovorans sp.]